MTITTTTLTKQYNGNASTTIFAYDFKILAEGDINVYLGTPVAAPTTWTLQTLTTHYTVSGVGEAGGGNITFVTAPPSGTGNVFFERSTAQTQSTDYVENDPFPADTHEDALDRATVQIQELQEEIDRCFKLGDPANPVPDSGTVNLTQNATNRASKYVAFDTSGDLTLDAGLGTWQGTWATATDYVVGDIVKDTNPTPNVIYRCNTAHTSTGSLPISSNADVAKWDQIITDGATGATGTSQGVEMLWDSATADSDQGAGTVWINNATASSATVLYMDDVDDNAASINAMVDSWDDSTSTIRGTVTIRKQTAQENFHIFNVTGAVTSASTYSKIAVTHVASAGTISDTDAVSVNFTRTGDFGISSGYDYLWDSDTADSDSGAGKVWFNNATLASVTTVYIDDVDANSNDIQADLDTWDDSTSTTKGTIKVTKKSDRAVYAVYNVTGSVTSASTYSKVGVAHSVSAGSFSDGDEVNLQFSRTGDKGDTGAAGGGATNGFVIAMSVAL